MDSKLIASQISKFSFQFLNQLDTTKSVVSSPLSAEILLALLTLGATDEAHSELLKALDFPNNEQIRQSFAKFSSTLRSVEGVTLNVANKIYLKAGEYELMQDLQDDAIKIFDAEFEKINFTNSMTSAKSINQWVESKTNNRIKDLISPNILNNDTRIVLVNALYFKGSWKSKFKDRDTRDLPFYVNKSTPINIPMMRQEANFNFGFSSTLQCKLLEMPYVGNNASMLVVLPNDIEGIDAVIGKLAAGHDLTAEMNQMRLTKVRVTLPKFKIETKINVKAVLQKLGINAIFNGNGLTKILSNNEPLFVSHVVQKAFIEVNEDGAEAAAATAMVANRLTSVMKPPVPEFNADHPFLALILINKASFFLTVFRRK